jgi:hypothetical protein
MKNTNLNRIALLYRDLLSSSVHSLSEQDKKLLLSLKPNRKILTIGDIDYSNWNSYVLTYLLENKLVCPTVLDESKIYQSMHAMRTHNEKILHPQFLISQSVVIRMIGLDNLTNINDYINSFINMCVASDDCKIIFVVIDGDKKFYKNNLYIRKTNSTFIETSSGRPYTIDSTPLCISPDEIAFFNYSLKNKSSSDALNNSTHTSPLQRKRKACSSLLNDSEIF